ncbi:hypothetical protein F2Q69_00009311 [Brassica cretica]|uniref:Uncharacterized protein n=1 Tax=Brassica cretica TaxID=69181 RepID=A0A8S9NQL7_BRACR|nr:hypothetical protein F2Q69_00009311 [Brassica cretica]
MKMIRFYSTDYCRHRTAERSHIAEAESHRHLLPHRKTEGWVVIGIVPLHRRRESSIVNRMQEADLESGSSQNAERELSEIEKKLGPPKQTQGDPPVLGRTRHHTHSRERRKGR